MTRRQPESHVVTDVLEVLGMRKDCKVWRQRAGRFWIVVDGRPQHPVECVPDGSADISGILLGGRRLELECKRPRGGEAREDQERRMAMIRAMGGVSEFVRSGAEAVRVVEDALYGSGTGTLAGPAGGTAATTTATTATTETR